MFPPDTSVVTVTVTSVSGVLLKGQLDLDKATGAIQTEFLDLAVLLHRLAITVLSVEQVVMAEWFALVTSKSYLLFL